MSVTIISSIVFNHLLTDKLPLLQLLILLSALVYVLNVKIIVMLYVLLYPNVLSTA